MKTFLLPLALLLLYPALGRACGPFFPESFLTDGNEAGVLDIPKGDFGVELGKIISPPKGDPDAPHGWGRTLQCDLEELKAALAGNQPELIEKYSALRQSIKWADGSKSDLTVNQRLEKNKTPRAFDLAPYEDLLKKLPAEFALYARGAAAYHTGQFEEAVKQWKALLALPAGQRRYRSTWAAYMTGMAFFYTDPLESIPFFEQTRKLAGQGYHDSLGLAAMSLGWQAWVEKDNGRHAAALRHYYEMGKAGGSFQTVCTSLSFACEDVFKDGAIEAGLVGDPAVRRIVTAWTVSSGGGARGARWYQAVKSSGVQVDPDEADRLAWGAYRAGDIPMAAQWLSLAGTHTPIGEWVRSKLLLRDGKIAEALAVLKSLVGRFPEDETWNSAFENRSVPYHRIQGERATLLLGRQDYIAALDAFLHSGYRDRKEPYDYPVSYWEDAAYIAERVLTLEELHDYVHGHEDDETLKKGEIERRRGDEGESMTAWEGLNYLLARRMARAHLWTQARRHYPEVYLPLFDDYQDKLQPGLDSRRPAPKRAESLFEAAWVMRYRGLALFGAEGEPDWAVYSGDYPRDTVENRRKSKADQLPAGARNPALIRAISASRDELDRIDLHSVAFNKRFHYRYRASELAWQASLLLPDNDPLKAAALYWGGQWHRGRDDAYADRYYKALVRRCPQLPIAAEADKIRWFPHTPPPTPAIELLKPKF